MTELFRDTSAYKAQGLFKPIGQLPLRKRERGNSVLLLWILSRAAFVDVQVCQKLVFLLR